MWMNETESKKDSPESKESSEKLASEKFDEIFERIENLKGLDKNTDNLWFKILGSVNWKSRDIAILKKEGDVTTVQVLSSIKEKVEKNQDWDPTGVRESTWKFKLTVYQVSDIQVNEEMPKSGLSSADAMSDWDLKPDDLLVSREVATRGQKIEWSLRVSPPSWLFPATGISFGWDSPFVSHNKVGLRMIPWIPIPIPIFSRKKRKDGETVTQSFWNVDLVYDKLLSKDKLTPEEVLDELPKFEEQLNNEEDNKRQQKLNHIKDEESRRTQDDENRVKEIEEEFENLDDGDF